MNRLCTKTRRDPSKGIPSELWETPWEKNQEFYAKSKPEQILPKEFLWKKPQFITNKRGSRIRENAEIVQIYGLQAL